MADAVPAGTLQRGFEPSFFFWISLVMLAFVVSGFGLTYLGPLATGSLAPTPPVVHLHGLFYFSWMLLLVLQTVLVQTRRIALHRSLGMFGIFIATGMVALGALLTVLFSNLGGKAPGPNHYTLSYLSVVAVPAFGLLFWAAIAHTHRPPLHRALMLMATIALLPPGINRLYMVSFGLSGIPVVATYLTMDLLLVAVLAQVWRSQGRVPGALRAGAAVIVVPQLLHAVVVDSAAFASLCTAIGSFAVYR